jgi:hypothetical protein
MKKFHSATQVVACGIARTVEVFEGDVGGALKESGPQLRRWYDYCVW